MKKKLCKSRTDKVICGVCGGFAKYLNIDSVIVRLLCVLTVFSASGLILYIIAAIIMPYEDAETENENYEYAEKER